MVNGNTESEVEIQPREKSTFLSKLIGGIAAVTGFKVAERRLMNNSLLADRDYIAASTKDNIGEKFQAMRQSMAENYKKFPECEAISRVGADTAKFRADPTAYTPNLDEAALLNLANEGKFKLSHMSPSTYHRTLIFSTVAGIAAGAIAYQGFKYITKSRFQPDKEFESSFTKVVEKERKEDEIERESKRSGAAIA